MKELKELKQVKTIETNAGMKVNELVREFESAGVMQAGALGKAASVLEEMIKDKECKVFMGVAGALVPAGLKKCIIDFIENKWIDALAITSANLTHDLIESLGGKHFQGSAALNDAELQKKGFDRIFNSLMENTAYVELEKFCNSVFEKMPAKVSGKEFLELIGKELVEKSASEENKSEKKAKGNEMKSGESILAACYKNKIPVFSCDLTNSGIGMMSITGLKEKTIDLFADLKEFNELVWEAKRKGVFYVCGGVSKNFIQQAMQFSPKPADFAVQITTARVESGGSSGAELREGISWGKLAEKARFANVYADATICLPLITASLKERLK